MRPLVEAALRHGTLRTMLQAMLPTNPEYRALKDELRRVSPEDRAKVDRLRANLERWRWMPRDLGERHLLVNVAAFSMRLIDQGGVVGERTVIVGRRATPTPQFATTIEAVIFNPWWDVPTSIASESVAALIEHYPDKAQAQGYVVIPQPDGGRRIRQAPGPQNTLGQMKTVMPNGFGILLHDTPAKSLFRRRDRALSHGCVRVDGAIEFAALLLRDTRAWPSARITETLATNNTAKAALATPLPVWVAYFTAGQDASGSMIYYQDPYRRDDGIVRVLEGRPQS